MVDRIGRWEPVAKSIIFLPMAISAVGASVIWRFVYYFQPANRPQTGLLNAIVTSLGGDPVGWLVWRPWNNLFLIVIMIWLLTGFCMVIISAAVKGVPDELLEAARIDGANEITIFFRVIIPTIRGTLIVVATTVLIMVLKVFDIVFVMTSGQFGTEVIANRMYAEMFKFRHFGRGSALAVILLVAVVPVMIANIRNMRENRR
jgi:alpha-glucoside transport system permease protein